MGNCTEKPLEDLICIVCFELASDAHKCRRCRITILCYECALKVNKKCPTCRTDRMIVPDHVTENSVAKIKLKQLKNGENASLKRWKTERNRIQGPADANFTD